MQALLSRPKTENSRGTLHTISVPIDQQLIPTSLLRCSGKVELSTYYRYCKSGASDIAIILLFFLGYLGPELLSVGSQLWLSEWSSASAGHQQTSSEIFYFQGVYAFLSMSAMGVLLARAWIWADVVVTAARHIHEQLLSSILRVRRAPTSDLLSETPSAHHTTVTVP